MDLHTYMSEIMWRLQRKSISRWANVEGAKTTPILLVWFERPHCKVNVCYQYRSVPFSVVQQLQYYNNKHLLNLTLRLKTYLMSPNTTTYHNNMKAFSLPPHTDIYCKLKLATTKVFQNQADI